MKKEIDHSFYVVIDSEIKRADYKADKYRNAFYGMRITLIVIAGIITIISGLQGISSKEIILNVVLILGALITALTSIDTLFQIETKKNIYKLMVVELREIRSEIVYLNDNEPGKLQERIVSHLFPKYQSVMAYSRTLIEKKDSKETPGVTTPA
jgi:hypothetical protein